MLLNRKNPHGGDIYHNKVRLDFSANINPAGMPDAVRNALRDAGLHAMNEIYASWETCVREAYERYQYILEEKAAGRLPQRKREISDYLLEVTARSMAHRDRLRSMRNELLRDMRDTASGMMENFEEAGNEGNHD